MISRLENVKQLVEAWGKKKMKETVAKRTKSDWTLMYMGCGCRAFVAAIPDWWTWSKFWEDGKDGNHQHSFSDSNTLFVNQVIQIQNSIFYGICGDGWKNRNVRTWKTWSALSAQDWRTTCGGLRKDVNKRKMLQEQKISELWRTWDVRLAKLDCWHWNVKMTTALDKIVFCDYLDNKFGL